MRFLKVFSFLVLMISLSFISTGVTHAAVAVDGPYIDTTTQGDWTQTYATGGSCFYLLPTPPPQSHIEFDLKTTIPPPVCVGGSLATSGKLVWDIFTADPLYPGEPIYVYYFDPADASSKTMPGADQWNPCKSAFYGATFDNGDLTPPRDIFEPLVSKVITLDYTGSLRIAYYFLEEVVNCREQEYKLFVNDELKASGIVSNFNAGKYAYFNISGLVGTSTIRLEVVNTETNPVCNTYGNVHFSGIFIDKCGGCVGTIGNYVWEDANKNGKQDTGELPLSGVKVNISGPNGYSSSMMTNAAGFYQFTGLCPGTYEVSVVTPAGYASTPVCFNSQNTDFDANCSPQTVVSNNDTNNTIDFGFYKMTMCPGTGTPGYWKNHPEAWPVSSIMIGNVIYTKAEAIALMGCSDGNKLVTMFRSLVAAKLNALRGCGGACIDGTIATADAWMTEYAPSGMPSTCSGTPVVPARSSAWKIGEPLYKRLDKYNNGALYVNGVLCAPSRDYIGDPHPALCPPETTTDTGGGGKKK